MVSALALIKAESNTLMPVLLVGAPLRFEEKLFNCAVVLYRGRVLGIVPKSYLPNYREYYEKRQFSSARHAVGREVSFLGETVPFSNDLVFDASNVPGFSLHVEICEDAWAPISPSTYGALSGATILTNLSASNITAGKTDLRRTICASQSAKCVAAYMYSASGTGESTTDLAWDGYAAIYENSELLAESKQFASEGQLITGDIDLDRLMQERMRISTFNDAVSEHRRHLAEMRHVPFEFEIPMEEVALIRHIDRFPYVPSEPALLDGQCFEIYNIQVHSLIKRLTTSGIEILVIGVSGGLDSTQALIVAAKTLVQHLIRWVIKTDQFDDDTGHVLQSILDTDISPELIPNEAGNADEPEQKTESTVGPYDIQDFNLYYILRYGYRPSKVAFLAYHAWGDKNRGHWPKEMPENKHAEYDLSTIKKWLGIFLHRFFKTSQFKRSTLPNGPKVGPGGSLSPRGDWRAPSDSEETVWLDELKENVPDIESLPA